MNFLFIITLTYFSTCHCWAKKDERHDSICGLPKQLLESSSISLEINKKGFHRELVTTVEFSPDVPSALKVLLVHRFPSGIYVDPYQLTSMSEHSLLQILLDSTIDLEMPAHKTMGFVALVYPTLDEKNPRLLKVTVPVHGRYHEPSVDGKMFASVTLEPPDLLLRANMCAQLYHSESHTIVDAPCTVDNLSMCQWIKIQPQQEQSHVSVQIPVGDRSLVTFVCTGTLLITMMCCVALSKIIWKHGDFKQE
ncbi:phosphatidylinositol-glycan biosynthesis class X protein [Lampris incognitus]|uniref:phosphatidylinositol-glycan biosynthesis class X protein n=1 Tax=Lampris incognitus TaxID=2546036 RepID=UPI0024B53FD6|nr:phosphatidylinositol-glycan biosynthesis class X protein [Lampris incognitus]